MKYINNFLVNTAKKISEVFVADSHNLQLNNDSRYILHAVGSGYSKNNH